MADQNIQEQIDEYQDEIFDLRGELNETYHEPEFSPEVYENRVSIQARIDNLYYWIDTLKRVRY